MITLCMDTSHIYLSLALIRDNEIIGEVQEECWKHQSEEIFPKLEEMLSKLSLKSDDIDQIVITKGPGSYTGVRIAMTIAKVFCSMTNKPLYTLPTMLLYAGMDDCHVVLDARGKRVYTCAYKNGKAVEEERVEYIADLENIVRDEKIIGDGQLFGKETSYPNMANNFLLLKNEWQKAENVHLVVPEYLKSSDAYNIHK